MTRAEIRDEIHDKLTDMVLEILTAKEGKNEDYTEREARCVLDGAKEIAILAEYINEDEMRGIWKDTKAMFERWKEKEARQNENH